jgi:hypothetical protein
LFEERERNWLESRAEAMRGYQRVYCEPIGPGEAEGEEIYEGIDVTG